jgi:predicted short-subunit dehydrogenase-like oxidoreductase (DUF2520 family)
VVFCAAMAKKPKISIVGPGRLGTALAVALNEAGFGVEEIVSRDNPQSKRRARQLASRIGATAVTAAQAKFAADVIWLCVGDGAIRGCAESLREVSPIRWNGKVVFHASGALSSDELGALRKRGASVASVHPMMSFVHAAKPSLRGVTFALEGDAEAVRVARGVVREVGGETISISKRQKSLYHAWGAFGSPLIIAELAAADRIAHQLGLSPAKARKTLAPMLRQTLENYLAHGPAKAFSGPLVRGDVGTVRAHLKVLEQVPGAKELYLALARTAIRALPVGNQAELRELLGSRNRKNSQSQKRSR